MKNIVQKLLLLVAVTFFLLGPTAQVLALQSTNTGDEFLISKIGDKNDEEDEEEVDEEDEEDADDDEEADEEEDDEEELGDEDEEEECEEDAEDEEELGEEDEEVDEDEDEKDVEKTAEEDEEEDEEGDLEEDEEDEDTDEECEEGDEDEEDAEDEEEFDTPDFDDWETPYEVPKALAEAYDTELESGTCWGAMTAKKDILLDEARWWSAQALPDSEGKLVIDKVIGYLLDFQLVLAKNRLDLEKLAGDPEFCQENKKVRFLNTPLEQLKLKIRRAGWLIDTGDELALSDNLVEHRCTSAERALDILGKRIDILTDALSHRAEIGRFDDVSNTQEILLMALENYGNAASLLDKSGEQGLEERMRQCTGARDEIIIGLSLFTHANKFHRGDKVDRSSPVEEIDAKIKMFLDVIAQKRLEALLRESEQKEEILALLAEAQAKIIEVQKAFALLKYDSDPDVDTFDDLLEEIKLAFKPVIEALENSEAIDFSKAKQRSSAKNLIQTARKQIKSLNKQIDSAEDNADTDEEEEIVQFVEQTSAVDAENARKAANGYRSAGKFENAQLQALDAIETAKAGKALLEEID